MSRIITPKPDKNSAANRNARICQSAPPASGTSTSGVGNKTQPRTNAGPTPIPRLIRPAKDRAEHAAYGSRSENEPQCAGVHTEGPRRVENEKRPEDEVEEVDRRGREQRGADHTRAPEVLHPRLEVAALGLLGRRLGGIDRLHRERGGEERDRVRDERRRRGEDLYQQPAHAWAADERERTAAAQE